PAWCRRESAGGRRNQVPAEAGVGVGLQSLVHVRGDGAVETDLRGRSVRLVEAWCRPAADGWYMAVAAVGIWQHCNTLADSWTSGAFCVTRPILIHDRSFRIESNGALAPLSTRPRELIF